MDHIFVLPALCSSSVPGSLQMLRKSAVESVHLPPGAHSQVGDKGVKGRDPQEQYLPGQR